MFIAILTLVLRELRPSKAQRRPAVFILEVAAALLSVLALRDAILGHSAMSSEALLAVGLWGVLLAVASGLAAQEAWSAPAIPSTRDPARHHPDIPAM